MANIDLVTRRRAPGTRVSRVPSQPRAGGVSISDAGMVFISKKGPTDERLRITSYEHYVERYGGLYNNNFGAPSAQIYFNEGGEVLHCVRIAGSGASVQSGMLKTHDGLTNSVLVKALDKGGGFVLEVDTRKYETAITTAVSSGTTAITFSDIRNVEQGDLVNIGGTAAGATYAFIQDINSSTKQITVLAPLGMVGTLASGTKVYCSTVHRVKTALAENYVSGSLTMRVANASFMFQGQRLYVSDKTNHGTCVVRSVNGNIVSIVASMGTNITAATSFVVSQEFNALVLEDGVEVENHEFLSLEDDAPASNNIDHVEIKLAGENNNSIRISMTDLEAQSSFTAHTHMTNFISIVSIPVTFTPVQLSGGADGQTPTPSEWIGSEAAGSESGLYLFNDTKDIRVLAMPGQTDVTALRAGIDYCESHDTKANCNFVTDPPLASDLVDEVISFRHIQLQRSTPFAALLYPWVNTDHPEVPSANLTMPPSPFFMGLASKVVMTAGMKQVPGGVEYGKIRTSIRSLTRNISDAEHALLQEAGIIPIRFDNTFGYHFKGARNLSSIYNGFEYWSTQTLFNFISATLEQIGKTYELRPNNEETRDQLQTAVDSFMRTLHAAGELYPQDNPALSYFVKCDDENNPLELATTGNMICDVGAQGPPPAEFITFRLSRFDGKVSVTTISA